MIYNDSEYTRRYYEFRPRYPQSLFKYITSLIYRHDFSWDCATGNGQAALGLTENFRTVIATDSSLRQIAGAPFHERIHYVIAKAERMPLPNTSVDLVTVALALHWFDQNRFYAEVNRVVRPSGVVACWTYHLQEISPEVDVVVHRLYHDILGPYWLPEIRHIENNYKHLLFPYERIETPTFNVEQQWDLGHLLGYLGTWSASECYRSQTGLDPLSMIRGDLAAAWGEPDQKRKVVWPLYLRVGRVAESL